MYLPYCAQQVYDRDRDGFLLSLFVPEPHRAPLHALLALNTELLHVRQQVTEEMIGHIRYAWWYEKLEALYDGQATPGHPVLEALQPLVQQGLLPRPEMLALAETYRAHFPELPHDAQARLSALSLRLVHNLCPEAEIRWLKARETIGKHRLKHPAGKTGRLALKLLFIK